MSNDNQLLGTAQRAMKMEAGLNFSETYSRYSALTVIDWLLIIPTLLFAGVTVGSSQDRAAGDMMTAGSSASGVLSDHLLLGTLCLLAMLAMLTNGHVIFRDLRRNWWISLSLAIAWISCAWSQKTTQTLRMAIALTCTSIFATWITRRFDSDRRMQLLVRVGTVAGISSILVALAFPGRGLDTLNEHSGALQGVFWSKNHCARSMLFLLTAGLHRRWSNPLLKYFYILLVVGVILMTRSVTGILLTAFYFAYIFGTSILKRFRPRGRRHSC